MARKDLVNKLKRRKLYINKFQGSRPKDKMDKSDEILADSPKSFKLLRGIDRRLESNFGSHFIPSPEKIKLEELILINDLDRFDFDPGAGTDFGMRMRVDAAIDPEMEETEITTLADLGEFEEFTINFADGGATAQADYFTFEAPDGDIYAVWLDIDAAGTAPTGAAYVAADQQVEVDILSTDNDEDIAAAVVTALGVIPDLTIVDNLDGTLTFTYDVLGNFTNADTHNANDSGAGSIAETIDNEGVASNLQNKYFFIHSVDTDYYVWFNVNGEGIDPAQVGTAVMVALNGGETDAQVATALAAELDALDFDAAAALAVVTVTNEEDGSVSDASDGNTGFGFNVTNQGISGQPEIFQLVGIRENDIVEILEGELKGYKLQVIEIVDANTVRLEDVSTYTGPEIDLNIKIQITGNKATFE